MLTTILDSLRISASNDDVTNNRTHPRRAIDSCVGVIDGKIYPIKNWSQGGVLFSGLDRTINENEEKAITLKFKLVDRIMDITHTAKVLRKTGDKFAMQFSPLSKEIERGFQLVIDDYVTREFANSQS